MVVNAFLLAVCVALKFLSQRVLTILVYLKTMFSFGSHGTPYKLNFRHTRHRHISFH